jgi:hypothetical protein
VSGFGGPGLRCRRGCVYVQYVRVSVCVCVGLFWYSSRFFRVEGVQWLQRVRVVKVQWY